MILQGVAHRQARSGQPVKIMGVSQKAATKAGVVPAVAGKALFRTRDEAIAFRDAYARMVRADKSEYEIVRFRLADNVHHKGQEESQ